ncbi:MAG: sigma factor [Acholeplasma sp.]|nr:sigma factor [Acholeplasma sp.]
MYYKAYNDYELIYLVRDQQDMMALELMFEKYDKFIHKKISQFYIFDSDREDFHQEGLIMLHKAILTFKDGFNKTFLRYFETILERRFINLTNKRKRYHNQMTLLVDEAKRAPLYIEEEPLRSFKPISFKSPLEEEIYTCYFLHQEKIPQIAKKYDLDSKQVYNAIYRIKKKLSQSV